MNFNRLSKMFERNVRTIKKTGRKGRKLAPNTYAYKKESFDVDGGPKKEWFEIECYRDAVLQFYPDDSFELDNHGRWGGRVLKDRFRSVLPQGGRISSWRLKGFSSLNQFTPIGKFVWTLWMPGLGTFPWRNNVVYDQFGQRADLCLAIRQQNAGNLIGDIKDYAALSVKALMKGALDLDRSCGECSFLLEEVDWELTPRTSPEKEGLELQGHLLQHVTEQIPSLPLLLAVGNRHVDVRRAVLGMTREFRSMWTYARTQRAVAKQMELGVLHPELKGIPAHPTRYTRWLRWLLTEQLLEAFGFEVG